MENNAFASMGTTDHELGWDDQIEKETDLVLLPEGDYDFTVIDMKRERHEAKPDGKLPSCNQATLTLKVVTAEGKEALIIHRLYLHTTTESMLSQFFTCIGQKKKGEPLKMNWSKVVGTTGKAKIGPKLYKGNQYNNIIKLYPYTEMAPQKSFTPGKL